MLLPSILGALSTDAISSRLSANSSENMPARGDMRHLTASETQGDLHLIPFSEELALYWSRRQSLESCW